MGLAVVALAVVAKYVPQAFGAVANRAQILELDRRDRRPALYRPHQ